MKYVLTHFNEFVNEELKKIPATYNHTDKKEEDREHNRLASKKKDGHEWKRHGTTKSGNKSITKKFTCPCGYQKQVVNDENEKVTITYTKK